MKDRLQGALDRCRDARPASIAMPFLGLKVKGAGRGGGRNKRNIGQAVDRANKEDEGL